MTECPFCGEPVWVPPKPNWAPKLTFALFECEHCGATGVKPLDEGPQPEDRTPPKLADFLNGD